MKSGYTQGSVVPEPRPTTPWRRGKSFFSTLMTLFVLTGAVLSVNTLLVPPATAKAASQNVLATTNTLATAVTAPAFNNVGIGAKPNFTAANLDGGGYSYSYDALKSVKLVAGNSFAYDGLQLTWPDVKHDTAPSTSDNWQANGQTLPLSATGAHKVGFIGAATGGAISGNAVVAYSDNSTQSLALGFSDWTLGAGSQVPAYNNKIFSAQPIRNTKSGEQTRKTYLFYVSIQLDANKTPVSVTLPTLNGTSKLHVFAYSNTTAPDYGYNNVSISDDAYTTAGNFDGLGNSYSSTYSVVPGATTGYSYVFSTDETKAFKPAMEFSWPDVPPGAPDNYQANGQTIPVTPVANAAKIGFVGAATGGPSYGTAYINYSDGTRQQFTMGFSDWTLNSSTQVPSFGNTSYIYSGDATYYNTSSGQKTARAFKFYSDLNLQAGKTMTGVTLPASTNQGQIHVFTIATAVSGYYDNVGTTDSYSAANGNFDGANRSYSDEALKSAGITYSEYGSLNPFRVNGIDFYSQYEMNPDNWIADGQEIAVDPLKSGATGLGFVGAATNGGSTGKGLITYTDGTTQEYTLSFTDWWASTTQYGNSVVAKMPYLNSASGKQNVQNRLYYADVNLQRGKTIAHLQLPVTTGGQMHIFAVGERTGIYNNTGISSVNAPKTGNLDGGGYSYSMQALNLSRINATTPFALNGYSFSFSNKISEPAILAGNADNFKATGQTILLTPQSASNIGFILSSIGGGASGTATLTYDDGTTQDITLGSADWCDSSTISKYNVSVAATMAYRNAVGGQQSLTNYLYHSSFSLNASKRVVSITLPDQGQLHIFSIAFK
ncbi:hypothetical protein [Dictyobacter alpinus]|nr:hypothetical protein [Dictyobacter alpinus]